MKNGYQDEGYGYQDERFLDDVDSFRSDVGKVSRLKAGEDLTALVIGQAFMAHMKEMGVLKDILAAVDGQALRILEEIQRTLDDDTLDDPTCFKRIEKILTVLETNFLGSTRHDF